MKKRILAMAMAEVLISLSLLSGCGNDTETGSVSYDGASESSSQNGEVSENGSGDDRTVSEIISDNKQILKSVYEEYGEPSWMNLSWKNISSGGFFLGVNCTPQITMGELDYFQESLETIVERTGLPDTLVDDIMNTTTSMGYQTETFTYQAMDVGWIFTEEQELLVTFSVLTSEEVAAVMWDEILEENN